MNGVASLGTRFDPIKLSYTWGIIVVVGWGEIIVVDRSGQATLDYAGAGFIPRFARNEARRVRDLGCVT